MIEVEGIVHEKGLSIKSKSCFKEFFLVKLIHVILFVAFAISSHKLFKSNVLTTLSLCFIGWIESSVRQE